MCLGWYCHVPGHWLSSGPWQESGPIWAFVVIIVCLLFLFFEPGTLFTGNEKIRYAIQKEYKNQAGINLTPPPPSQNSHVVRWHCTAESEWRVAEIKS